MIVSRSLRRRTRCRGYQAQGCNFRNCRFGFNHCQSLLKGENTIRTVGSVLNGQYGIRDVATNVPTIIGYDGVERVLEVDLDPQELRFLQNSADQVKTILNEVKDL